MGSACVVLQLEVHAVTVDFEKMLHELAAAGPAGQRAIAAVGQEAGPALRALLNQGVDKLDELKKSLQGATGSAAETAAVMQANLNGALNGLRTAWDSTINALTTPVLPVLKEGVEQLAGALRSAVADGTVGRFGTALATAFQNGIKWVQAFVASVDVPALLTKAQTLADRVGALLDSFGQKAQSTGSIVQTVWGVASGGANLLIATVFRVAEAFADVTRDILTGVAIMMEGLSKISFGGVSAAFKQAATEVRESAAGMEGVTDAFGEKSAEAFERATKGAEDARAGWAGLSGAAETTTAATNSGAAAFSGMAAEMKAAGETAQEAGQKAASAAEAQKVKAEEARASIVRLRGEYDQAIATGNLQLAVQKLEELKKANLAAADAAVTNKKAQADAAAEIEAAFICAGVQTKTQLETTARTALRDFELTHLGLVRATSVSWQRPVLRQSISDGQIAALATWQALLEGERAARVKADERADKFAAERNEALQELWEMKGQLKAMNETLTAPTVELGSPFPCGRWLCPAESGFERGALRSRPRACV